MPVSYKSIKKPSKRGYFCVYFLLFHYFLSVVFHKWRFECIPSETYTTLWIVIFYFSKCYFVSVLTVTISCSSILFYEYELRSCTTLTSYCNVTVWIGRCLIEENYISFFWNCCNCVYYSFPLRTDKRFTS